MKPHATVSTQHAPNTKILLLDPWSPLVSLLVLPLVWRWWWGAGGGGGGVGDSLLVRELRSGFDKSVLREAGTPELCRRGCHYILTCHCLSTEKLQRHRHTVWIHIQRHMHECVKQNSFFFSFFCLGGVLCPKISLSIPTDGLITGLLRHAGMLVCAALRQREAARHGYKYLTTNHVHTLSQGCTSPAATRTATTGKFSATRAEGSAGALTSTAERWWAPESMATQTVVSNPQDNPQSSLWAFLI